MSLGRALMLLGFILSVISILLYVFTPNTFSQNNMYIVAGTGAALMIIGTIM
jgi:competence protein ComGC